MRPSSRAAPLPFEVLGRGRRDPRTWWRGWSVARRADVLVAFGGPPLLVVAVLALVTRRPFVYRQIGDPSYWGQVRFAQLRVGWPLRRAARIVALWAGAGDELVRRYRLDPRRVEVIANARDGERFGPPTGQQRLDARAALQLGPEPVALYLGALAAEKRPADAIEAVAAVAGLQLVLAGDGPLRPELEAQAAIGAPGRTRFLGSVPDPVPILHAADVLVCPSETEGMAGCLLEAALVGLPVVATRVGAAEEVVPPEGGALVAAGDVPALAAAIRSTLPSAPTMGPANRRWAEQHFTFEVVVPRWARLLEEVGGRRR